MGPIDLKVLRVLAVLIASTLIVACGSSSSSTSSSGTSAQAAKTRAPTGASLGSVHKATGMPIVLGLINEEGSQLGSFPTLHGGAQAAVNYVNTYRDGVGGRPLKLDYCISTGDASSSAGCATKLLGDHPVAFVGGADFGTPGSIPVLQHAHLSMIGGSSFALAESTASNSRVFAGFGFGVFPGISVYAAKVLHAKRVAAIYQTAAGGIQVGTALLKDPLVASGVTDVKLIPQNSNSSDFTSAMAAAVAFHPDAIVTIVTLPQCVSELKAHQELAGSIPLLTDAACIAPQVLSAAGSAANGAYMGLDYNPPGSPTPDVQVFEAAMHQYSPSTALDEFAQAGFGSVMNIWKTFNSVGASNLTTAKILSAVDAGTQANFMAHPYHCDKHIVIAPSVCNGAIRVLKVTNGQAAPVDNVFYDGSQYVGKP